MGGRIKPRGAPEKKRGRETGAGRGERGGNETTCDGNLIPAGTGWGRREDFLKLFKLNRLLERWREDAGEEGGEKRGGGIREEGREWWRAR